MKIWNSFLAKYVVSSSPLNHDTHFPLNFTICQRILGPRPMGDGQKMICQKKNYAVGTDRRSEIISDCLGLKILGLVFCRRNRGDRSGGTPIQILAELEGIPIKRITICSQSPLLSDFQTFRLS